MGNTLKVALQWSSSDEGESKLELSPVNDMVLNRITEFAGRMRCKNPAESKFIFKQPLVWNTTIDIRKFLTLKGFVQTPHGVVSRTVDSEGKPLIVLSRSESCTETQITAHNLESVARILNIARENYLSEARACIEANRDPVVSMLGDDFAPADTPEGDSRMLSTVIVEEYIGRMIQLSNSGNNEQVSQHRMALRLFLLLKQFDEELMLDIFKLMVDNSRLTPAAVDAAVEMLKNIETADVTHQVIEYVRWMMPYTIVLGNGCRAPFWRQLLGDIAYLEVKLNGRPAMYITAGTSGYFMNGGPQCHSNEVIFDREGEIYRDLLSLLRNASQEFGSLVEQVSHSASSKLVTSAASVRALAAARPLPTLIPVDQRGASLYTFDLYRDLPAFHGTADQPYVKSTADLPSLYLPPDEEFVAEPDSKHDVPAAFASVDLTYVSSAVDAAADYSAVDEPFVRSEHSVAGPVAPDGEPEQPVQAPVVDTTSTTVAYAPPGVCGEPEELEERDATYSSDHAVAHHDASATARGGGGSCRQGSSRVQVVCDGSFWPCPHTDHPANLGLQDRVETDLPEFIDAQVKTIICDKLSISSLQRVHEAFDLAPEPSAESGSADSPDVEPIKETQQERDHEDEEGDDDDDEEEEESENEDTEKVREIDAGGLEVKGTCFDMEGSPVAVKKPYQRRPRDRGDLPCKKVVKRPGERKKTEVEVWLDEVSSDDGADVEEEVPHHQTVDNQIAGDLSTDRWYIAKLFKYIKSGDDAATMISLCSLRDLRLDVEGYQMAIVEAGGLEALLNILELSHSKCVIAALKVLSEILASRKVVQMMVDLGGVQVLLPLLYSTDREVQFLAAETLSRTGSKAVARQTIRAQNSIAGLIALLDGPSEFLHLLQYTKEAQHKPVGGHGRAPTERWPCDLPAEKAATTPLRWRNDLLAVRAAAVALASIAVSRRCRAIMKRDGIMRLLVALLRTNDHHLLLPAVTIVKEFAKERIYRTDIVAEGMISEVVKALASENHELVCQAAHALFRCAEDERVRDIVRQCGGLERLVKLIENPEDTTAELLLAVTGAMWKLSLSEQNVAKFQGLGIISILINLLRGQPERVVTNVAGVLSEMTRVDENRQLFAAGGGIHHLLEYLSVTDAPLLINVNKTLAYCALHRPSLDVIAQQDGIRLIWSLLRHPNSEVQASAAWAVCPCVELLPDSSELVRSLVGALELLVNLLKSDSLHALAGACRAIATIADKDEENLAIMTDQGVVSLLARLTCTADSTLRQYLADAIGVCCSYGDNRFQFGKEGVVVPLVKYLHNCKSAALQRATARALHQLSRFPENCIVMHHANAVRLLLPLIGSHDHQVQEDASRCIFNIRRLLLANQRVNRKARGDYTTKPFVDPVQGGVETA